MSGDDNTMNFAPTVRWDIEPRQRWPLKQWPNIVDGTDNGGRSSLNSEYTSYERLAESIRVVGSAVWVARRL